MLILLSSLFLSCYRIGEPLWEAGHHGFILSEYPHNALNYLRYGYINTKLGLVTNFGDVEPEGGFQYRVDHGPVTAILISLAYQAFGVSEWSARLVPALLSIGTSVITCLLALRLTGSRWTALAALGFVALSPVQVYYARLPVPHNVAVFFCILAFYAYYGWFKSERPLYLVGFFAALAVGAYTDWIAYFVPPAVLAHYLVFYTDRRNLWLVLGLAVSPFVLFASYLLWTSWMAGAQSLRSLWTTFLLRTISSHDLDAGFSILETWSMFLERSRHWLTLPVVILSIAWLGGFLWRFFSRRATAAQGLVPALFLFAFSHNVVFANRVMVHDFAMVYQVVPAFAMASALALIWIVVRCRRRSAVLGVTAALLVSTLFGAQSLRSIRAEHHRNVGFTQSYYVGKALRDTVPESRSYIDAVDLYEHLGVLRTYATADRSFDKAVTLNEFLEKREHSTYAAAVVANSVQTDPALRRYLVEHYPREDVSGYSVFELTGEGSNILVNNPSVENPYRIRFGSIEFLGFDVDRAVCRKDEQIGWLERYLNRHNELLPGYRTTFSVTNYWRKVARDSSDYELVTQFDAEKDRQYRLEQSYGGLDELYPTSFWPVGQVIREDFLVTVPADYPSLSYAMWVGLSSDMGPLAPNAPHAAIDGQNRVSVGQVYVSAENRGPCREPGLSALEQKLDVNFQNGISLVRVRASQQALYPGDLLLVTLDWSAQRSLEADYKIFVHLTDSEGHVVGQHDAGPDLWRMPTSQWTKDTVLPDVHPLCIPNDTSSGTYQIRTGMYSEPSMTRVPVTRSSEPYRANAVVVAPLRVLSRDD